MTAPTDSVVLPSLNLLPNFRILSAQYQTCCNSYKGIIYRSSRPDFVDEQGALLFNKLGINSIIDFRSRTEYTKADGQKRLDNDFQLCQVLNPHRRNYRPLENVKIKRLGRTSTKYCQNNSINCECNTKQEMCSESDIELKHDKTNIDSSTPCQTHSNTSPVFKTHYLVDFFSSRYIWTVFNRASWFMQLCSLLCLVIDLILNTGYLYFVRFFAHHYLNDSGLIGQYKDMVDLSQRSICAALKLLTDPINLPALLNCAHGKDRTGIVSALVLHCLGKSKEFICKDYAKSAVGLKPIIDRVHYEIVNRYNMSETFVAAEEETMIQLLVYIENKYGSVDNYLEYIGFGTTEQKKLRQIAGVVI